MALRVLLVYSRDIMRQLGILAFFRGTPLGQPRLPRVSRGPTRRSSRRTNARLPQGRPLDRWPVPVRRSSQCFGCDDADAEQTQPASVGRARTARHSCSGDTLLNLPCSCGAESREKPLALVRALACQHAASAATACEGQLCMMMSPELACPCGAAYARLRARCPQHNATRPTQSNG